MQPFADLPPCSPTSSQDLQARWLSSAPEHNNRSSYLHKAIDNDLFSLARSASTFDRSAPFSPISPNLRSNDYPPPALPSPSPSLPLDDSALSNNLGSLHQPCQLPSLSLDPANAKPFQPASLPVPKRAHPISNIWAQPIETPTPSSSCGTSDFELNSPLPAAQGPMIARRFSHLSSNSTHSRSLIGSPSRIPDFNNSASLSVDRHRGNLSPSSPLTSSFAPNSLPATIYQPWHDTQPSARPLDDERTGRSKARDILGSRPHESYRDPSVGSIGSPCSSSARSGIGLSNMSPFTGNSLLLPHAGVSLGGTLSAHNIEIGHRPTNRARDSSLGAIGSGRMTSRMSVGSSGAIGSGLGLASASRMLNKSCGYSFVGSVGSIATDSWFMGGRSLSNDLDEDDEFAQPTKSGATSRRHSVSAFTARSLAQGFESVLSRPSSHNSNLNDKKTIRALGGQNLQASEGELEGLKNAKLTMFGSRSSALTEDDLSFSSDLNSLNLNLEAHAHQQQYKQTSFEFSHSTHPQPPRPIVGNHQPSQSNFQQSIPPFTNSPWSNNHHQSAPSPALPVLTSLGAGHGNRKSSFSAGDPFSASAQASRYFASQATQPAPPHMAGQPTPGSRFLFSHAGPSVQSSSSLSSPSVTTFSASGLLSTPSPGPRQAFHGEMGTSPGGGGPTMGFEGIMSGMAYALPSGPTHGPISPLSPSFQPSLGHPGSAPIVGAFPGLVGSYPPSGPTPGPGPNELGELGKGIPLHEIPRDCLLYIVEFKGGRTDLFYTSLESASSIAANKKKQDQTDWVEMTKYEKGDFVVVEADRGKDLGRVLKDGILVEEVERFWKGQVEIAVSQQQISCSSNSSGGGGAGSGNGATVGEGGHGQAGSVARLTKEIHPKKIFGKATLQDVSLLPSKTIDESKALSLCRSKALQRGLKMEIRGAEWQWDRRKLTFFFVADKRVDFRELVKDLFRTWKTRIWMCSVNP